MPSFILLFMIIIAFLDGILVAKGSIWGLLSFIFVVAWGLGYVLK